MASGRLGGGVLAAMVVAGPACAASLGELEGDWQTHDGTTLVRIADCGDGTPCGTVVAVDAERGGMTCDERNADHSLRGRDMVGITLFHGFRVRRGSWRGGAIYNPKDGRTYRAKIELVSKDALAVSGCLGPICQEHIWERADRGVVAPMSEGEAIAAL